MQNKFDDKIVELQKDHDCDVQKAKISQGHIEDGQKFLLEEQIVKLKMTLKAKEDKLEEATKRIETMKRQHGVEREQSTANNQELLK